MERKTHKTRIKVPKARGKIMKDTLSKVKERILKQLEDEDTFPSEVLDLLLCLRHLQAMLKDDKEKDKLAKAKVG